MAAKADEALTHYRITSSEVAGSDAEQRRLHSCGHLQKDCSQLAGHLRRLTDASLRADAADVFRFGA